MTVFLFMFLCLKAFIPAMVDLPAEMAVASYNSITLPENFANVDILLPDPNLEFQYALLFNNQQANKQANKQASSNSQPHPTRFLPGQLSFINTDQDITMSEVDMSLRRGLDFSNGDFGVEIDQEVGREAPSVSEFPTDDMTIDPYDHKDQGYDYGDFGVDVGQVFLRFLFRTISSFNAIVVILFGKQ